MEVSPNDFDLRLDKTKQLSVVLVGYDESDEEIWREGLDVTYCSWANDHGGSKIATVANNTSFALTDGTFVYVLPTVARDREDMSMFHADVEIPEGALRRYGILSIMDLGREGLTYQAGMDIAVVSERRDGTRLLYITEAKVPA